MNPPKYKKDDEVLFSVIPFGEVKPVTVTGKIYIVDRYGTFEQNKEVSYDIFVDDWLDTNRPCLVKHIVESNIHKKVN